MVTHQLQVERRTAKERWSETDVLPLSHADQQRLLCQHIVQVSAEINTVSKYYTCVIHWHQGFKAEAAINLLTGCTVHSRNFWNNFHLHTGTVSNCKVLLTGVAYSLDYMPSCGYHFVNDARVSVTAHRPWQHWHSDQHLHQLMMLVTSHQLLHIHLLSYGCLLYTSDAADE